MYYSATIFQYAGLKSPTAVGLVVSGTNCLWTLVAVKYVDRIGRRRILLYSIPVAIGGLIFASIVFRVMTNDTNQRLLEGYDYSKTLSSLMIVAMVVFISGYATGLGNVPWNQGEVSRCSSSRDPLC